MARKKINVGTFCKRKEAGEKVVMLTCHDAPSAAACHAAGVDALLVGDSLAMTVLGYDTTLPVTMEEMLFLSKAVRRGAPEAFMIFDMPFMSYQASVEDALRNAGRAMKEAGADAIKLEGGVELAPLIRKMVECGVPVLAHIGLMPQHIMIAGGYRVTGKTAEGVERLLKDARAIEEAGAFAVVLECMPGEVGKMLSGELRIPTIGIGSGVDCDGQVQVLNDLLGVFEEFTPKHAKRYAELGRLTREAVRQYAEDVRGKRFPGTENTF